jgi:hypothetical protein
MRLVTPMFSSDTRHFYELPDANQSEGNSVVIQLHVDSICKSFFLHGISSFHLNAMDCGPLTDLSGRVVLAKPWVHA